MGERGKTAHNFSTDLAPDGLCFIFTLSETAFPLGKRQKRVCDYNLLKKINRKDCFTWVPIKALTYTHRVEREPVLTCRPGNKNEFPLDAFVQETSFDV